MKGVPGKACALPVSVTKGGLSLIYLLEDDASIRKLVVYALESQGFEAQGFERPSAFFSALSQRLPRLVILDVMLPEQDGLSVLTTLRQKSATAALPVILLTARNTEYDRVQGLDLGADDFISKPFGIMELLARVRALLRRAESGGTAPEYRAGALRVFPDRHEVTVEGMNVSLTHKEYLLLCLLMENRGRVLPREILLERVWGLEADRENRTLDVHIRTLRSKLGAEGARIQTVRGVGYRLSDLEVLSAPLSPDGVLDPPV